MLSKLSLGFDVPQDEMLCEKYIYNVLPARVYLSARVEQSCADLFLKRLVLLRSFNMPPAGMV